MSRDNSKPSRHLQAFKENFNVVGLATAAAISAATLTPIPLLLALVAEAAYLLFVPDSRWYDQRLARKYDAEVAARRLALKNRTLPSLKPETRDQFVRLEQTREQLATQPMEGQQWWLEVLRKLDYLLEKFLLFASKEIQFRAYLAKVLAEECRPPKPGDPEFDIWVDFWEPPRDEARRSKTRRGRPQPVETAPPRPPSPLNDNDTWTHNAVAQIRAAHEQELEGIHQLLAEESDENTKAVLNKRVEVIRRRQEHISKIGRILVNLNHQLLLLDDTFGLINDEIRARPPEQVLGEIEDVVSQTDTMTQLLEDIAPYEQMIQRLS